MKRITILTLCAWALVAGAFAQAPSGAIPFVLDSHLYLQATVLDTVGVTLIYDTGADMLYLDKDYMEQSSLGKRTLPKGYAKMGGTGNNGPQTVPILVQPITIKAGNVTHQEPITPIINLRDILGRHLDGMIGNNMMLKSPFIINYTDSYLLPVKALTPEMTKGYTKLDAQFVENRILIDCELDIDASQKLRGLFTLDLGCGSGIVLTSETLKSLNLDSKKKAYSFTKDNGVGGDGADVNFRADAFKMLDTLSNVVVSASLNTQGALAKRNYMGLIGNDILRHYDLIIDVKNKAIYARRNGSVNTEYQKASRTHMAYIDRTDICDGWIVKCLYENGKAQKVGIEIGDIILAINGEPTKDISWERQRKGLDLNGETTFTIKKQNGTTTQVTITIDDEII